MRELTEQERAEVERDAALPQLDARELVDEEYLERAIKEMYTEVAENPGGEFHFTGRALAEGLGYDPSPSTGSRPRRSSRSRAWATTSTWRPSARGECVSTSAAGRAPTCSGAAVLVGPTGRAISVEMTAALLDKARRVRDAHGFSQVELVEARIEEVPLEDGIADCVISNGVINLAPDKGRALAEAVRLLKPRAGSRSPTSSAGGRSVERTRRVTDLWAACIGGAIPRDSYFEAIEATGLRMEEVRENAYEFLTERALGLREVRRRQRHAVGQEGGLGAPSSWSPRCWRAARRRRRPSRRRRPCCRRADGRDPGRPPGRRPEADIEARLDLVAATGVRVTRVDVLWNELAPTRPARADDLADPAYRWSRYDRVVDGLARRGIAAILNVYRSPSWANGGRGPAWALSEADYGAFMTALARRYDGVTPDPDGLVHGPVEPFRRGTSRTSRASSSRSGRPPPVAATPPSRPGSTPGC